MGNTSVGGKSGKGVHVVSLREYKFGLCIRTFGGFQLIRGRTVVPLSEWKLNKSLQLFKYLLVHRGRPVSVPQLLGVFWPDMTEQRGRRNLQATLYVLRRVLEPDLEAFEGSRYLRHNKGKYTLYLGPSVWLDLEVFEHQIRRADKIREDDPNQAREHLKRALKLYQDRFLPEDVYEDWTTYPREYYHDLFVQATLEYARLEADAGNVRAAIDACRKALAQDPYQEEIHRALMMYYLSADRRLEAIQQYRHCVRMLEQEYGVLPSKETEDLYREIMRTSSGGTERFHLDHTNRRSPRESRPVALSSGRTATFDNQTIGHEPCPTCGHLVSEECAHGGGEANSPGGANRSVRSQASPHSRAAQLASTNKLKTN